jgi:integration host factor subunit beta
MEFSGRKGDAMNKSELIEIISEKGNVPKKRAEEVVNLVFDSMTEALVRGDRIEIRGFGSFVNRDYGSYTGRNPRTGESIEVQPKKLPFFKVGKELKERVDGAPAKPAGGSGGSGSEVSRSGETVPSHPSH